MKRILVLIVLFGHISFAQHQLTITVLNQNTRQPLAGASVTTEPPGPGGSSNSLGRVQLNNLSKARYEIRVSCIGYESSEIKVVLPLAGDSLSILLEPAAELLQDMVVSSTRTNSKIKDLPVRVEVLGTEDMEEETSMHPGNVAMLLSEASGIQTQQTSASSGNVQIRILGLDGKYTQLLKDGFPLYSGFSNGLSIMQIPPLDLRQVELIKGSSSSLYGGDAIAGIINFISKKPVARPQWNFLANQTSRNGTDMGSFYTARNKHWGLTLLNTFTRQSPADIHNNGFTVLPRLTAFTAAPKLFWYPADSITLSLALNTSYDNRAGGDLQAVEHGPSTGHPYLEKSNSNRHYYQLEYQQRLPGANTLTVRNSVSLFNRTIGIAGYTFSGRQTSSFSEASWLRTRGQHKLVAGFNVITDQFTENRQTDSLVRDYSFVTTGIFVQDDWSLGRRVVLEAGLRNDYQNRYGNFLLPRLSLLYRASGQWSLRAGGGLGYKPATIFDAQTEETAYKNILPISSTVSAERSAGVNLDVNYSARIDDDARLLFNQSFFYTRISNPLQLDSVGSPPAGPLLYFHNTGSAYTTRGFETSIRWQQDDWSLFAGYTYIDARTGNAAHPHIALTPGSKLVFDLANERENNYRVALEAFYTGRQYLYNGAGTPGYWVTGLLIEKVIKRFTLVLNFEDLTDTRQTRFGPVVLPPYTNPGFADIYAPLEGFMANLALKLKLL